MYLNTRYEISHPAPNSATLPPGKEPKRQPRDGCKEKNDSLLILQPTALQCTGSQTWQYPGRGDVKGTDLVLARRKWGNMHTTHNTDSMDWPQDCAVLHVFSYWKIAWLIGKRHIYTKFHHVNEVTVCVHSSGVYARINDKVRLPSKPECLWEVLHTLKLVLPSEPNDGKNQITATINKRQYSQFSKSFVM
jgi:hypothetical protein